MFYLPCTACYNIPLSITSNDDYTLWKPNRASSTVFTGLDTPDCCQRVSDALAEGYQLYGNPVLVVVEVQPIVGQSVIWPNKDIWMGSRFWRTLKKEIRNDR